jgi:hypothetical protein
MAYLFETKQVNKITGDSIAVKEVEARRADD